MLKSKLTDLKPEHIDPIISELSAYFERTGTFQDLEQFAHLRDVADKPLFAGLIRHYTKMAPGDFKTRVESMVLEAFYIGWHARGAVEDRDELEGR